MRLVDALSDFLYDKKYFITLFEDNIHIYRYLELKKLSSMEIVLQMTGFILIIKGNNLLIRQMNKEEILINGKITDIGIKNE